MDVIGNPIDCQRCCRKNIRKSDNGSTSQNLNDVLRSALEAAKKSDSLLQISKACGVPYASLHDYLAGKDMYTRHAATLAEYLGLELRAVKRRRSNPT
mgnify:CR=1 FL=1